MGARHKSRQAALAILYQADIRGEQNPLNLLDVYFKSDEAKDAQREFVESLVMGVTSRIEEIDETLKRLLVKWELERLGYMERAILRMGAYELLFDPLTPGAVALNEAVELAKDFCDKDSVSFINGVLDAALKGKRAPEGV
ncbi:MAG: transcription antitermination factor NusB [Nitrospinae bacterium]|nr:transcription antitermination factor NusB [Nitrospinota bacterium]MBF0634759.1 transcription antitermination factor NusB [Nitrospinota bacterium]